MLPFAWQRVEAGARLAIPIAASAFMILLGAIPWPLPDVGAVAPAFGLIAVYYWAIHRPDIFGPVSAFALGLLHDAINFMPLGISSFIFLALHQLLLRQRRFFVGQAFYVLWAGFGVMAVFAQSAQWGILSLYEWRLSPPSPTLAQIAMTIAVFPIPAWALIKLHRLTTPPA